MPESLKKLSFNTFRKEEQNKKEKRGDLAKIIMKKMQKLYPALHIKAKTIQTGNKQNNVPESYLFDIWAEPLILKQKPTTITLLNLTEEELKERVEKTLKIWKDSLAKEVEEILKKEYPTLEITFVSSKKFGGKPTHFFNIKCPGVIPSNDIEINPSDSLATRVLSVKALFTEAQEILNTYKE